jgi:hypothetical protein
LTSSGTCPGEEKESQEPETRNQESETRNPPLRLI